MRDGLEKFYLVSPVVGVGGRGALGGGDLVSQGMVGPRQHSYLYTLSLKRIIIIIIIIIIITIIITVDICDKTTTPTHYIYIYRYIIYVMAPGNI